MRSLLFLALMLLAAAAQAAEIRVAVAANFQNTLQRLAVPYAERSGHRLSISARASAPRSQARNSRAASGSAAPASNTAACSMGAWSSRGTIQCEPGTTPSRRTCASATKPSSAAPLATWLQV